MCAWLRLFACIPVYFHALRVRVTCRNRNVHIAFSAAAKPSGVIQISAALRQRSLIFLVDTPTQRAGFKKQVFRAWMIEMLLASMRKIGIPAQRKTLSAANKAAGFCAIQQMSTMRALIGILSPPRRNAGFNPDIRPKRQPLAMALGVWSPRAGLGLPNSTGIQNASMRQRGGRLTRISVDKLFNVL